MIESAPGPAPDVSVIIAAYNAEAFLQTAVDSALAQAAADLSIEIIIVDDASTDSTVNVARALADRHEAVRVFQLATNGGPSAARNAGLDAARGAWIAVLDADDAFEASHLPGLKAIGDGCQADIVLSNIGFYNPAAGTTGESGLLWSSPGLPVAIDDYVRRAQPFTDAADWGLLKPFFRRAFLARNAIRYPLHSRHGEDFLIIFDALCRGAKLMISPAPSYRYTTRESGWSRTQIDYRGQVEQARALIARDDVRTNAALVAALRSRVDALDRWNALWLVNDCRQRRNFSALFGAAASSRHVRAQIGKLALGKTASMLGLGK